MRVTMKNVELMDLYNALKMISEKEKFNKFFIYAAVINEDNIYKNVKALLEIGRPSDSYIEYEKEREKLIEKYADSDEDGNLLVDNIRNTVKIKHEMIEEAKNDFASLDEQYKDVRDEREKDMVDYRELLNKTVEVELELVKFDHIPELINKLIMRAIKPMINIETAVELAGDNGGCGGCSKQ